MKNLLIAALSAVVMLSGCASSRTFQPKKLQVDKSRVRGEAIQFKKALETARDVLKENKYDVTYSECKSNHYARIKAKKWVGFFSGHNYRTEIKITKTDEGHKYQVSSSRRYTEFLDPLNVFRLYHRDQSEEEEILDDIGQKSDIYIVPQAKQPKKPPPKGRRADAAAAKKAEQIKLQKATEIAREVLKENRYELTYYEWKANEYVRMKAKKFVGFLSGDHYRIEIKITKTDNEYKYDVSSSRKRSEFFDFLDPFSIFRMYRRDQKEEKKIRDGIEQKYQ